MYRVIWVPRTLSDLTAMWLAGDSEVRQRITDAVARLDDELRRNAPRAGESRDAGRRILIDPPLSLLFRVDESARTATVSKVWQFTTPE